MNETAKTRLTRAVPGAVLCLLAALLLVPGVVQADTKYLGDGAIQNAKGGWDLPAQGTCPADTNQKTRPDCLALRLVAASSAACTAISPAGSTSWTTSGVCNDLDPAIVDKNTCESKGDRFWNSGTSVCAIVMKGDDRNNVVCAKHGGTWVTTGTCIGAWVMPNPEAYAPRLLTGATGAPAGTGDQCLRCHNAATQYNGPRVRDTEDTLYMGHKNMSRKVTVGTPWGGPPFKCVSIATGLPLPQYTNENVCEANGGNWDPDVYPADDSGNTFNWVTGQITVSAGVRDLTWIYGDWLAALPRAIYKTDPSATQVCSDPRYTTATCVANGGTLILNAGASYSCGRCHTTGWTSDATINTSKEPEASFAGITFDRLADATFGKVNLSGGVTGDANKYSSWDQWGITCTRCHNSAVDTATGGGVPPHTAPAGMSTHHNNLTAPDNNSGVCTDARFTAETQCAGAGGSWVTNCSVNPTAGICTQAANTSAKCAALAVPGTWVPVAGWCSNAFYTDSATCIANGNTWQDGYCTTADTLAACTGGSGDAAKTWRANGTKPSCQVAGATWGTLSKCSVEGYCNKGTGVTSKAACDALGGQFAYATDIVRCIDAGGHWTGNNKQRGQIITRVCMDCHRQETGGLPYDSTAPAQNLKVGPAHGTVAFVSHPAGNQFLNSPHGKFTGTFAQIATGKFLFGSPAGEYQSFFMNDGEAANTGNGCTGCHDVHTSTVAGEKPFREECTACHTKSLNLINHPKGTGTPMPSEILGTPEEFEACVSCHMPEGQHSFRINVDQTYSTFPMPAALSSTVNANTAPDGTFASAVWVDLDHACGKCHGGGTAQAFTTGSTTVGSANVTVASTTGFVAGQKIRIAGAGALYYDDLGVGKRVDLDSYIKTVTPPSTITLVGSAAVAVTNKAVVQNAVTNGGAWISKAALAGYAKGIHADKPFASFTSVYGANGSIVNVDASASKCSGSAANCNAYSWNWGDGTPNGSGVTASHTYATPGTYTITLTVAQYSVGDGVATQQFTAYAVVNRPTAAGSCVLDYAAWTATCNSTGATPDAGFQQVVFDWGDGTVISTINAAPFNAPVVHKFVTAGNFTIKIRVQDTLGQIARATITTTAAGSFTFSTISGTVRDNLAAPLGAAQVQVKLNGTLVKSTMTAANGTYSLTIKPGTYTVGASKSGYTFPAATSATVPPAATVNITAN